MTLTTFPFYLQSLRDVVGLLPLSSSAFFADPQGREHSLMRKRIAAAVGIVALAVTGPLVATGTAQASPTTPYMCPWYLNDGVHGIYGWQQGYGQIICYYNSTGTVSCRYNAYTGDDWYYSQPSYGRNPSYCPTRAIPTTA
jgi:hypothetical protein